MTNREYWLKLYQSRNPHKTFLVGLLQFIKKTRLNISENANSNVNTWVRLSVYTEVDNTLRRL